MSPMLVFGGLADSPLDGVQKKTQKKQRIPRVFHDTRHKLGPPRKVKKRIQIYSEISQLCVNIAVLSNDGVQFLKKNHETMTKSVF
jgi:hypothetical protein